MAALGRIIKGFGTVLDRFRKVLHFIFLMFFFLIIMLGFSGGPKLSFGNGTALLINPAGPLVNQLSGDPVQRSLDKLTGNPIVETLTRDVVRAIRAAQTDKKIKVVVLDLGAMAGAGLTDLHLVSDAIDEFKTSGKKVLAYGAYFSQGQYLLAAHADELYMHPSGFLFIDGFGRFRHYYKEAIEKLSIDWNVFKVGEFKSFVEPYLRNDMSPEDRASSLVWMNQLWNSYRDEVVAARGLEAGTVDHYANNIAELVKNNDGDLAKPALSQGLIDDLLLPDQFDAKVVEIVGKDNQSNRYRSVELESYIQHIDTVLPSTNKKQVGVVVASGQILDGDQPPGTIGGSSLSDLLRRARHDKELDALVLYIDSPGGSKFASELIQRELQLWKQTNRPLIAVMSSVAASGGYWIAMEGDEIWASPSTITGSIGIGGYIPTFQRTMARLGVHADGVGTTRMSGSARIDRELGDDVKEVMQKSMEHGYFQFISSVAAARNMSVDEVDKIARGRVWSGKDAQNLGLVDRMGTLDDGIKSAANLAGLGDKYEVKYLARDLSIEERLTLMFSAKMHAWSGDLRVRSGHTSFSDVLTRLNFIDIDEQLALLTSFNDPKQLYIHCFCDVR